MPVGAAGERDAHPVAAVAAGLVAEDGKDGADAGQRPPRGDGLDPVGAHARPGAGDVVAQQHHERLARRALRRRLRRGDERGAGGAEERHRQHSDPPAQAGGSRAAVTPWLIR